MRFRRQGRSRPFADEPRSGLPSVAHNEILRPKLFLDQEINLSSY